jgi:hypothetical protein
MRLYESRVLRRIFGPRLQNEELHNLYASSNIIRVIKLINVIWAGHVARMEEIRKEYVIFVE